MARRLATTHWEGGLQTGKGTVSLDSSRLASFDVTFPSRAADEAGGQTSPEELIAAAHASCFSMQLSALLERAGTPPTALDTTAEVTLGQGESGPKITLIALRVAGTVPGASAESFQQAADQAKQTCPVSVALAATPITLQAALAG